MSPAHLDIVAPVVSGARPGTVVGAAEILDSGNRRLGRVALRAEMSTVVEIPRGERCLVHGWSPYLSVPSVVVTGGHTRRVVLSPRRGNGTEPGAGTPGRTGSGWVRLWTREQDGQWAVQSPEAMASGEAATVATPLGEPVILQVGGSRRYPVCTRVPEGSLFTLRPAEEWLGGRVDVRPVADSGFTLLEALRHAEWGWAAVMQQVWWDDPGVHGDLLFDLAVAYFACRRGDVERIARWRDSAVRHEAGSARTDVLTIDVWLARRTGGLPTKILARLADAGGAPLVAEGLDLIAAELARHPHDARSKAAEALRRRLAPHQHASVPSSLSSFTAANPEQPELRPAKRDLPGEALSFKVKRDSDEAQIQWRALTHGREEDDYYAPVAAEAVRAVREPDQLFIEPTDFAQWLIVENEDPMVLWRLSRALLDTEAAAEVSIVPGRDAIAVALAGLRPTSVAALLAALLRQGRTQRLELSVGSTHGVLDVTNAPLAEHVLAQLLRVAPPTLP